MERVALVGVEPADRPDSERVTYQQAKEVWERRWLAKLLRAHDGNLSRAARAARMGRSHLRELVVNALTLASLARPRTEP